MNREVQEGDKIMVTRFSGRELDVPHLATVDDVFRDHGVFKLEKAINGSDLVFKNVPDCDVWFPMSEYVQGRLGSSFWEAGKHETEDDDISLDASSSTYEDDAITPSYSEFINSGRGRTLADYTGVEITEDSLGFVSSVDEAISSITAESLNFSEETEDVVNHPSHYGNGRFETIEMIEEITKGYDDGFVAHCVGTAVKYESRAPFKHDNPLEDLRKARKYLEFAIDHLERLEDK